MTKIAFFEIKDEEEELIKKPAKKLAADVFSQEVEELVLQAKDYEIISPFIYSNLSSKILKQLPNLKMIATRSTGMDHIDLDYCKKNNIAVANVPHYGENTVAEQTFALILGLSRRLVESSERVKQGGFSPIGLTGFDLAGKTIAVVGVGNIGKYVVKIAHGFGMNVIGVGRKRDQALAKELNFSWVNLDQALKQADILSLHVPLTKETKHLINKTNIKKMKKGSILINTCRGPVVESEALLWALEENIIAGAGLDVLEEEESIDNPKKLFDPYLSKETLKDLVIAHLLREKPNVIITPHNAFNTKEALQRIIDTTINNIENFIKEKNN